VRIKQERVRKEPTVKLLQIDLINVQYVEGLAKYATTTTIRPVSLEDGCAISVIWY